MKPELLNEFLFLLNRRNYPVPDTIIYSEITEEEFTSELGYAELEHFNIIEKSYGSNGIQYFLLPLGRRIIQELPDEFANNPYGFLLKLEQETKEEHEYATKLSHEKLNLEVESLRNSVFDYNENKWMAKWGFRIAILSAILSAIVIAIQLIGKK